MIDLILTILLAAIAASLAVAVARRSRPLLRESSKEGFAEFLRLIPRMGIGVLGSGFIAAALPQDMVGNWLGDASGLLGIAIATIAGEFPSDCHGRATSCVALIDARIGLRTRTRLRAYPRVVPR